MLREPVVIVEADVVARKEGDELVDANGLVDILDKMVFELAGLTILNVVVGFELVPLLTV